MVKDLLKGDNHTCMNNPTNQIKFKGVRKNSMKINPSKKGVTNH